MHQKNRELQDALKLRKIEFTKFDPQEILTSAALKHYDNTQQLVSKESKKGVKISERCLRIVSFILKV